MNKCIVYTRFSPRRNSEECTSGEVQLAYCEQYAEKNNLTITKVFHDEAVSGSDEFREKLWLAIECIHKGDILLVYKLDRLARNVYLSEQINRLVGKKGGSIEAVEGDIAGNSPEKVMIRQILSVLAEYERKLIAQRTRASMRQHQVQGKKMGRFPPYGYEFEKFVEDGEEKEKLRPSPTEFPMLLKIRDMLATGLSFNGIAVKLNYADQGGARGKCWYAKSIRTIAKRSATVFEKEVKE